MSRSKQIDMSDVRFTPDLHIGCIYISKAHTLPLSETFIEIAASEISITFWGDTPEPWDDVSLASIRMFKLPAGNDEFQEQLQRFGDKRKKRARLPDGQPFDDAILAIRDAPKAWTHDAFARSGRDLIHVYQSKHRALLIRLLGKAGNILDNPLLKRVSKNLTVMEDQWIGKFPSTELRKPTQQKLQDVPLTPDVVSELNDASVRARELLNLGRRSKPLQVAEAIHQAIDEVRSRKRVPAAEKQQLAVDLGALWGDALCTANQWEWRCLSHKPEQESYAVCSPNRSHVVDPTHLVHSLLQSRHVTNNSLLLFNLVLSGRLPESPDGYCWLS